MKNLGWTFFFALLLGDVVALVMLKLGVTLKIVTIVAGLVAIILAVVMFFAGNARERSRKREQQTAAKLAELQEQVDASPKPDEPAK
jgi:Flp pilus assembly protein TadB